MLFKNFDKFSSDLHFSTLKLLLFSCRKSLRFFSAHILKLRYFPKMCVKNAKRRPKIITAYNELNVLPRQLCSSTLAHHSIYRLKQYYTNVDG